jgi:peptidoglycan/xylan/chitin deacetylase (PgdA/CDA1 family)
MKRIALTFDDGPNPQTTEKLLAIWRQFGNGGHGTWFLQGDNTTQFPQLALRVKENGHEIANHTYDHIHLEQASPGEVKHQIDAADKAITAATGIGGESIRFVRPPYGTMDHRTARLIDRPLVIWSADSRDWAMVDKEELLRNVLAGAHDGAIVLMHDWVPNTVLALPVILRELTNRGFKFMSVSELLDGAENDSGGTDVEHSIISARQWVESYS